MNITNSQWYDITPETLKWSNPFVVNLGYSVNMHHQRGGTLWCCRYISSYIQYIFINSTHWCIHPVFLLETQFSVEMERRHKQKHKRFRYTQSYYMILCKDSKLVGEPFYLITSVRLFHFRPANKWFHRVEHAANTIYRGSMCKCMHIHWMRIVMIFDLRMWWSDA